MCNFIGKYKAQTYALMRIAVGGLFLPHGGQKLFGWFGGMDGAGGTVEIASLIGVAGALEFFGGLLVLLGLFTRQVSFVLSGLMFVAYFMAHSPQGLVPLVNGGEMALLYAFAFLYMAAKGSGIWSIDKIRS